MRVYKTIKPLIRLALRLFFAQRIKINATQLKTKGPLLLIANHPNSFLDAIIIAAAWEEPIHFLARGDAFKKNWHRFLLRLLQMIPIYRMREGRSQVYLNNYSFAETQRVLNRGGIVLIFIEGICINSHVLQPFKKGAARIIQGYKGAEELSVIPVALFYEAIPAVGKKVRLVCGKKYKAAVVLQPPATLQAVTQFNERMREDLQEMIPLPNKTEYKNDYIDILRVGLRFICFPLFFTVKKWVLQKTKGTVFFDSVLFGVLFFLTPLYLIILTVLLILLVH